MRKSRTGRKEIGLGFFGGCVKRAQNQKTSRGIMGERKKPKEMEKGG